MSCMNYALRLKKNEYKGPLGEKEYFEDNEEEKHKIKKLIDKIKTCNYIVVHAGAGISTSSGLQDFRGPTGIWTNEFLKEIRDKNKKKKEKNNLGVKYENSNNSPIYGSNNKKEKFYNDNFIKREKNENLDENNTVRNNIKDIHVNTNNFCEINRYKITSEEENLHENHLSYNRLEDVNNTHSQCKNISNRNEKYFVNYDSLNKNVQKENSVTNNSYENLRNDDHIDGLSISIKKETSLEDINKNELCSHEEKKDIKDSLSADELSNIAPEKYVMFGKRKRKVTELHLALPSKTHIMIRELMNRNIIKFLIIQNIDSLHYRCGIKLSKTSEIHGNIFIERCDFCGRRYLRDYVISTISFKPTGSLCFLCSFPPIGILTDALLDWNNAYEDFFHLNSIKHSQKADFHFCLGSSFYIVPASHYPSKKKYANKNSYSCLINYQKSFLSKEIDLNMHSNVNNVSDIIIKELSLNSLSIRNAKLVVVRCPPHVLDIFFDDLIKIKNIEQNTYYSEPIKKENNDCNENNSENDTRNYFFTNNDNNYFNEKENATYEKKDDVNNNNTMVNSEKKCNVNFKEQTFIIRCSMIKNIKTTNVNGTYKILIKQIDYIKGIWLIKTNFTCLLEIEMWYNSYILLKLIYNVNSILVEVNAWSVNVAYTYGDDLDDTDVYNNNKKHFKLFDLYKNKYANNMDTQNYDKCSNENEKAENSMFSNKHTKSNNNNNSNDIINNNNDSNDIINNNNDSNDINNNDDSNDIFNNNSNDIINNNINNNNDSNDIYNNNSNDIINNNINNNNDSNDIYNNNSNDIINNNINNNNDSNDIYNNNSNDTINNYNSNDIINNNNDSNNINNNNKFYSEINYCNNFNNNLENIYVSEILNEHVHVGYNPNNFEALSKVQLLAFLNNSKKNSNNDYAPIEISKSFELLYNLFCIISKLNEKKINCAPKKSDDQCEEFIKNFNLLKNINFYTNDFINSFIKRERHRNQSRYKFRTRKKRKLYDYSSFSSDENEKKKIFIYYDIYMNENKQSYKVNINKELIRNNLIKNVLTDSSSFKNYITIKNKNLIEKSKCININTDDGTKKNNILKEEILKKCGNRFFTENYSSTNKNNDNNYDNTDIDNNKNCDDSNSNDKFFNKNTVKHTSNTCTTLNENISNITKHDIEYFKLDNNKLSNEINKDNLENNDNSKENISNDKICNTQLLFYPTIFINNNYELGELVSKVPKHIKPKTVYTPYKKITRNNKFSNTLQKYRYEIWKKQYNEIINNIDEEQIIDSLLYKEICYFPFWILNYVNDLLECL